MKRISYEQMKIIKRKFRPSVAVNEDYIAILAIGDATRAGKYNKEAK